MDMNVNRVVAVDGCGCECEEWLLLMAVNVNRVVAVDGRECEQSGCC